MRNSLNKLLVRADWSNTRATDKRICDVAMGDNIIQAGPAAAGTPVGNRAVQGVFSKVVPARVEELRACGIHGAGRLETWAAKSSIPSADPGCNLIITFHKAFIIILGRECR